MKDSFGVGGIVHKEMTKKELLSKGIIIVNRQTYDRYGHGG